MATAVTTAPALNAAAKRREIIELRLAGHTLETIASKVGLAGETSVRYHLDVWLASQKPSSEQTEELRQVQSAQIDALTSKLTPRLESDDYLAVTDRLVKLMDRKARLMGLDLQQNVQVNVLPTAEQLASLFGWDAPAVIEGTATEEVVDG